MIDSLFNLAGYYRDKKSKPKENTFSSTDPKKAKDSNYSASGAVTLGSRIIGGGNRAGSYSNSGTFDYFSTAENTIECYYQKLSDLKYYESHALTEKIIGIFRDYITQLWKEGSNIIDVPGEDPELVEKLNMELEGMDLLEILMKDLSSVIYYGSVTYEISKSEEKDPDHPLNKNSENNPVYEEVRNKLKDQENKAEEKDKEFSDLNKNLMSIIDSDLTSSNYDYFKTEVEERGYAYESKKERAKRLVESTSPEVKKLIEETSPSSKRGIREAEEIKAKDTTKLNRVRGVEAPAEGQEKVGSIKKKLDYKPQFRLNKLKHPHHTVVEYHREMGRRYLIKATEKYHIPSNKHQIFYYGNDSMKLSESGDSLKKNRLSHVSRVEDLIGYTEKNTKLNKKYKALGIDPSDPKKIPTRYELMEREISTGAPLFYHYLPKVRELFLKDLVVNILGIKDVIQPDILAMNFEGGTNIDHAEELCNNLEDLLNKNSDYSIFNSHALDYNDLTKLLIDTVRVLPDIDGKLQSLNPLRTTTLQEKIQQIREEARELERDVLSSLGVPVDLFEGNSSKWEVIKRSERLQSRVSYYINTLKSSIRRLSQTVFYLQNGRELSPSDFKVTVFNESDLEMASKTNKLQNLTELSQSILNVVIGAERELQESTLINKEAYIKLLKANLKEIYPEVDSLLDLESYLKNNNSQDFNEGF